MKAGRFEGLTDHQWTKIESFFAPESEKRKKGMPHAPFRNVWNTIIFVLKNGSRWADVPKGSQWASKSASHRWLKRWQEEGVLQRVLSTLIEEVAQDS